MTPKKQAERLVEKYVECNDCAFFAVDNALIAVEEILDVLAQLAYENEMQPEQEEFWKEVKNELENYDFSRTS